jgi:hypothetical protein
MAVPKHALFGPGDVGVRYIAQRERHGLDDHVVHRNLVGWRVAAASFPFRRSTVQLRAESQEGVELAIDCQIEVRDRALCFDQSARDRPPHVVVGDEFI